MSQPDQIGLVNLLRDWYQSLPVAEQILLICGSLLVFAREPD
jgi:hypothetical protein